MILDDERTRWRVLLAQWRGLTTEERATIRARAHFLRQDEFNKSCAFLWGCVIMFGGSYVGVVLDGLLNGQSTWMSVIITILSVCFPFIQQGRVHTAAQKHHDYYSSLRMRCRNAMAFFLDNTPGVKMVQELDDEIAGIPPQPP
jgi:hypothetical protein